MGVRITPRGVDELPLIAIEVKNQQNQLNQQENKSIMTKHIAKGKRSLWRVLGYQKKPRHIRKVQRRELSEAKMGKTRRRLQMEEPWCYEALSTRDNPSGRSRWLGGLSRALTCHPRVNSLWLPQRVKPAWVTLCRKFFLLWVDQTNTIPKVGSPTENSDIGKSVEKYYLESR